LEVLGSYDSQLHMHEHLPTTDWECELKFESRHDSIS